MSERAGREFSAEQVEGLIREAQENSPEALGRLAEQCRNYLLLVAERELDSGLRAKGGASDLVQDTFVQAHRRFGTFRGGSEAELLAWLRRILMNQLANFRRNYQQTEKRQLSREVPLDAGSSANLRGLVPGETLSSSQHAIREEQQEAIDRAMVRLPEDYRQAILLRHRDGKSFEEIGQLLDRSAEAARKLWSRGVECLQRELEQEHEPS